MPTDNPPIDWTADYDIFDPDFVRDPYPTMHEIRESGCPIAHTQRWGASWMPTRYDDIVAVAQEHDVFTSRNIIVVPPPTGQLEGPYSGVAAPPITSDPPEHHWHRRTILPTFAPQAVAKYEDGTRALCHQLIDGFIDSGQADAAAGYAQQIPVRVIATMLGVPLDMADEFTSWVRGVLEIGLMDPKVRVENRMKILGYFRAQLDDRKANPRDNDLITDLLNTRVDGELVSEDYVMGVCNLMLVAGIDTTWSAIGSSLWHLAQHPEHRQQLRDRPDIWPLAIEELLRAYSPVTMARIVDHDTEFQGCPMHAGDRVLMSFPAANRDPRQFDNPDEVILDREQNRHVAFGAGIHRCAGSNLARLELRVALQTWLERIPEFELVDPSAVTWAGGQVRGPRRCLVRFSPVRF
ncbi:MAG TPA: cytochrome P450 [Ilumatobacteraceae bacterium]|nr:cytochrome P450 [Ilumatobacteraceae bacterium]